MSLALKWGDSGDENGGFIYMDAVTVYTQSYTGQVTKHPVDGGSNITDHFIRDNPTFTISAVITGVDISTGAYNIRDLEDNIPVNVSQAPEAVNVTSTDSSVLTQFLPDSIGQFLRDVTPSITSDQSRLDILSQVRQLLISLMSGTKFNEKTNQFDSNVEIVRIFEYEGSLIKRILNNLVMTSVKFNEDSNSGSALYCDLTFEEVTFVSLQKVDVPKRPAPVIKKKTSTKKSGGKCDSSIKSTTDTSNTDSQAKKDGVDKAGDVDQLRPVAAEI